MNSKLTVILMGIALVISVFCSVSLYIKKQQLQTEMIALSIDHKNIQTIHNTLETSFGLLEDSAKMIECNVGRRGILVCVEGGWQICFDSFEDNNPGDKNSKCCEAVDGSWHENKCCAPDRDNSNWIGKTGKCSSDGVWIKKE